MPNVIRTQYLSETLLIDIALSKEPIIMGQWLKSQMPIGTEVRQATW